MPRAGTSFTGSFSRSFLGRFYFARYFEVKLVMGGKEFFKVEGGGDKHFEDGICFAKIKRIKQSIVKARQRVQGKNYICPRHD